MCFINNSLDLVLISRNDSSKASLIKSHKIWLILIIIDLSTGFLLLKLFSHRLIVSLVKRVLGRIRSLQLLLNIAASTYAFGTYRICAKASSKRTYWRIQQGLRAKFWYATVSASIQCVCEQRGLWRVCAYAQTRLSPRCSAIQEARKLHEWNHFSDICSAIPHTLKLLAA